MKNTFYVTTAIHYVNGLPHIGHMYENIAADVIARRHRMLGEEVYFLTGTDEHGQKVERTAAAEGVLPIELADRIVAAHRANNDRLAITNDDFIRTTEGRHKDGVYEIIRLIRQNNPDDIYLGEHSGWYCSNEEAFFPESSVKDGKCENGHLVERTSEQNYFFRLSKYERPLLDFYRANPDFVKPKTRFNEVLAFVEQGLKDLSVSRSAIKWGIPFPGDPEHIIYVWLDALTNYISALGFGSGDTSKVDRYWPADIHLIGKDIVRFHAVYWPAFLMAAGLSLPKSVVAHGFWLRDNEKISKSAGNIVRPDEIVNRFGADAFRYFVMRDMVFGQDQNYSDESFFTRYNADLANGIGNTMARAVKMSRTYFDGRTPPTTCDDNEIMKAAADTVDTWRREMDQLNFHRAIEAVWKLLDAINGYIVGREPWKVHKQNGASDALSRVIWIVLEGLRLSWLMISPFMPVMATEALRRLGCGAQPVDDSQLRWGLLPAGTEIPEGEVLFPRIDLENWMKETTSNVSEPTVDTPEQEDATPRISIDDFFKTELRVAQVLEAENVPKSKKLIKMKIDTGKDHRTIVAGIATRYKPEDLIGRKVVIVANLQPAKLMGIESNGMVLAASIDGEPNLVSVDPDVPVGTQVR